LSGRDGLATRPVTVCGPSSASAVANLLQTSDSRRRRARSIRSNPSRCRLSRELTAPTIESAPITHAEVSGVCADGGANFSSRVHAKLQWAADLSCSGPAAVAVRGDRLWRLQIDRGGASDSSQGIAGRMIPDVRGPALYEPAITASPRGLILTARAFLTVTSQQHSGAQGPSSRCSGRVCAPAACKASVSHWSPHRRTRTAHPAATPCGYPE